MAFEDTRWAFTREALLIWQRLQAGPAGREELMAAVAAELPDAFTQESDKARRRHFERLLAALRYRLGAEIEWDAATGCYVLEASGPYLSGPLPDELFEALAFLLETFQDAAAGMREIVRPLLDHLQGQLSADQLRRLQRTHPTLQIEIRRLDEGEIAPAVWRAARAAIAQRRLLRFRYLAPRHDDRLPRTHTVEAYELEFSDGHYYLHAYIREWTHPDGFSGGHNWAKYRLDHVQAEGVELLPTVFAADLRRRRLIPIRYRIAPRIARGNVTHHFEEMALGAPDEDGWVEVTGKTASLFDAHRKLLAMGPYCVVLEPPELVQLMHTAAAELASLYADTHGTLPDA